MKTRIIAAIALSIALSLTASAATNSWTDGSSKWETPGNWSGGAPSSSDNADIITNGGVNVITIDGTTSASFPGTMTISNLVVSAPAGSANTLSLSSATTSFPLHVFNSMLVSNGGSISITGSALQIDGSFSGFSATIDGALTMNNGSILITNTGLFGISVGTCVGLNNTATLSILGGTMLGGHMDLGEFAGSKGTLLLSGGTLQLSQLNGGLAIGALGTGSVFVSGGQLIVPSGVTIGQQCSGEMTVTGGTVRTGTIFIGDRANGNGTLTVAGSGFLESSGLLQIGAFGGSSGTVWVTGGSLIVTNPGTALGRIYVGGQSNTFGQLIISNGTVLTRSVIVGTNNNAHGFFNVVGGNVVIGSTTVPNGFRIGDTTNSTGSASVSDGGSILVTNTATIVGNNGNGILTVSNGTVMAAEMDLDTGTNSTGSVNLQTSSALIVLSNLTVGSAAGATGTVTMTGGSLVATNAGAGVVGFGNNGDPTQGTGFGQMTIANASVTAANIFLGSSAGGHGILTVRPGGFVHIPQNVLAGGLQWNEAILDGGVIDAPKATMWAGRFHPGEFIVSNGVASVLQFHVGLDNHGTYTHVGGTVNVFSNLVVGSGAGVTGIVNITGGSLFVTNNLGSSPGTLAVGNDGALNSGSGFGQFTISNAPVTANSVKLGSSVGGHGILTIKSGGILHIPSAQGCAACGFSSNEGILDGGVIDSPDADLFVGQTHPGEFFVNSGSAVFSNAWVGYDNTGTVTINGGTIQLMGSLTDGTFPGATGAVWMTGGSLVVTNKDTVIGDAGVGQMTMSNGNMLALNVFVGGGAQGTFTMAGGTNTVTAFLTLSGGPNATGTLWMTGGRVVLPNNTAVVVGQYNIGRMTVSNGTVLTSREYVGLSTGSQGTLTLAGGEDSVFIEMVLGAAGCTTTGIVNVVGGSLYVTNAAQTATLEVSSGTLTISSGFVQVDRLVLTNGCGHLVHTGGTLLYSQLVLDPNQSAVGDGIPNSWKQQYGLDPFDPNLATEDPDGDGCNNLCEFLAGSNPVAAIKSITKEGTDIRVTWQAAASKTNALQRSPGSGGSYSNNFADIFTVTNNIGAVTNYLDSGAATSSPAFYYRIRVLVP